MSKDPTVPPRVSGPTRFTLNIKCQRMTLKSYANYKSANAVVNVKWWGDEEGITLHPLNINSSTKSSGATSFIWHVKCLKKQLSDYLLDMGNLNITVLDGENAIGIVKVPVATLTRDPIRPINAFYPILPVQRQMENKRLSSSKVKKMGELHVALELKPVSGYSHSKTHLEVHDVSFSDSTGTQTPRKKKIVSEATKENKPIKENMPLKENKPIKEHSIVEEPRRSPPLQHQNIIDAAFDDTSNDILDFTKDPSTLDLGTPCSPNVEKEASKRSAEFLKDRETPVKLKESKIPMFSDKKATESPVKLNNTKELDLIMQKAEKLRESMGVSLGASQSLLKKFSLNEDTPNMETASKKDREHESFQSSTISSTISLSDDEVLQLDDDAIIQALNDNMIGGDDINIESIDQLDELSDDAIRTKVISMVNDKRERCHNVPGNMLDIFSVDQLTSLGRIHSVYLSIEKFQVTDLISGLKYKIETHIPLKMNASHVFQTVAKLKKNRFEITNEHPNDVTIDYQDAHAIHFDSSEISIWLDGSIFIQITSEYLNAPNSDQKVLWIGTGILEAKEIITSPNLSWIGKVAIWNTDKNASKKLLGNLVLSIKLVSDIIPPPIRLRQEKEVKEVIDEPERKLLSALPSLYLFLNFKALRSQKLLDYCSTGSVLAYLSIRIPSLPEPIDTPPVLFNDYSEDNHRRNACVNVKHSFTLPFMTPQIAEKEQLKLIIEVWHMISSYETKIEGNVDHGPSLLGIVKLPFAYILALLENPTRIFPLVIPEAEYSVVDPFSGFNVGWLSTTVAVGSLTQVTEMKSSFSHDVTEKNRNVNVETGIQTLREDLSSAQHGSVNESTTKNEAHADETSKSVSKDLKVSDLSEHSSETVLSLTIHRVCGLKTLLQHFKQSHPAAQELANRFNSFLQLIFLPETEENLAEGDFDSSVVTDIVYDDFHYVSDTCVEMTIVGLGSEFIRWARTGGAARGEVICRIDNRSTFSLGYFDVPLLPLLENPEGIKRKWMSIFPSQNLSGNNSVPASFVQVSLFFKSGFDLGYISGCTPSTSSQHCFILRIRIGKLRFSSMNISQDTRITATCTLAKLENGGLIFEEQISPYWCCDKSDLGISMFDLDHIIEFDIQYDSLLLDYYKANDLELNFWSVNGNKSKVFMGTAFLNISDILTKTSIRAKRDNIVQKRNYDIINFDDDTVNAAQASIEISCTRNKGNSETVSDQNTFVPKEVQKVHLLETKYNNSSAVVEDYNIILKFMKFKSSKLDSDRSFRFSIDWPNRISSELESVTLFSEKLSPNDKLENSTTVKLPVSASQKIDKLTLKLLDSENCLGQVVIPISVLYLGLEDINGWYPIHSIAGESMGQLMVDICFSELLKINFRKTIRSKKSESIKMDSKVHLKDQTKSDIDTWKWNGSNWQHQSLQIGNSAHLINNNLRKSVHQTTLDELDNLQNLIRSIGATPKANASIKSVTHHAEANDFKEVFKLPEIFNPSTESKNDDLSFKPLTIDDLSHKSNTEITVDLKFEEPTKGGIVEEEHPRGETVSRRLLDNIEQQDALDESPDLDVNSHSPMLEEDHGGFCEPTADEILVFKSRPSLVKQLTATIRSVDDDGEIYEELARRRLLASRKNSMPDDKNSILNEAKKELIPSDIRKDDRLIYDL